MNTEQAVALARRELSRGARAGHAVLLAMSLCGGAAIASLWWTEPGLPLRTHLAFALLVLIAVAWSVYAAWVLTRRSILLVPHRVRAAGLGLSCTAVFAIGAAGVWWTTSQPAAGMAALTGVALSLVAGGLFMQARRRRARLEARLRSLGES